ncbi:MAG: DUF427 domain-containing protein [Pseudomonadota bacterium]
MADHIKIRPAGGTWVVRAGGAVLGESSNALELTEGAYPPVIYIPRGDIAMAFLEPSDKRSTCPHKGDATHYSIVTKSTVLKDAAWSYESPKDGVGDIAGHLAFYPSETVAVEQL